MKLNNLNNIGKIPNITQDKIPKEKSSKKENFADLLTKSLEEVNKLQNEADKAIEELATGEVKDIHGTMLALKKADISLQLMMQVRNKIIDAYQEIMRMQI